MSTDEIGSLVIGRGEGESFIIGDKILITIIKVKGKQVKVFIRAPKTIKIERLKTRLDFGSTTTREKT